MTPVDRFFAEVTELFEHPLERDVFESTAIRRVAAFVGRLAVTDEGFTSNHEVASILREARSRVARLSVSGDQAAKHAVLYEIDKALAVVGRIDLPPPSFT
jgi:Mg-chelatase subunit ChlI